MTFTRAIVRPPGRNFAAGLTTAGLGAPDAARALAQHAAYAVALAEAGLRVTALAASDEFADAPFVEDAAIVTARGALLTRPGAPSRRGEVDLLRAPLRAAFPLAKGAPRPEIHAPGTLDGGDVCAADGHFFIGVSARTNAAGARQLALWLDKIGYPSTLVDIRAQPGLLHLKSGVASLGGRRLAVADALAAEPAFRDYERLHVPPAEFYAANLLRVNDTVLLAAGFPRTEAAVRALGGPVRLLELSEFHKMDGGLSCLSLRW